MGSINTLQRLSMLHSPRWHQEKLWLLNSGTGEFGFAGSTFGGTSSNGDRVS
ncbi:DUF4915 domain-containing protein [Nostoc sp. DedQUE09]|uniref:DUF4915 domain-containing protein n=1 Tax=Nostoc sp. DedQUE09 TaxID=3075394 RepID=UPI002AD54634|nr:DUF4915 domain-containing protein [Nostoc sp. DedQUE09]MDZ7951412.1 DUF4915 domain-containing protein [Nostoc sp. DedQUE09]